MSKSSLRSKSSPRPNRSLMYHKRRQDNKPSIKPYGFCCSRDDRPLKTKANVSLSISSLASLHECPALRLREHVISKRPRQVRGKDGTKSPRSSSALKLRLQSLQEPGGLLLDKDATESALELMREVMRGRRQMEYEQRMDRWAAIGERKVKKQKKMLRKCGKPYWYTDFSIPQLQKLKELEDSLFKDKEEKTTSRTVNSLLAIGMITDDVKIEPREISRLLNDFSADPIKFLNEIYKAINGSYFHQEDYRRDYSCSERIILSGIAFLELPKIVLTLHQRLPPIVKLKLPPKPKPPRALGAKKMESPLLEKLHLPPNWRLYQMELAAWRKKFFAIPRPVVILPKQVTVKENVSKDDEEEAKQKKPIVVKDNDQTEKSNDHRDTQEKIESETAENVNTEDNEKIIETQEQEPSYLADEENKQVAQGFPMKTDWTNPPTACPYKYRKLLNRTGSLTTDEAFFAALNFQDSPRKNFPPGRENLSLKLQHFLLDVEADFFRMTEEADRLTSECGRIAREILEPQQKCDACCACRQTRKTHLRWHATKTPHQVIDGVLTDEKNQTQVIGALAMHSPAESVSLASEPPCVPSHDKFVKDMVITGNTMTIDGEVVRQVAGVTKNLEHVEREVLRPDVDVVEIRNVPPCGCAEEEKEVVVMDLSGGKDEEVCYGKKFRPREGPAYSCGEFGAKDVVEVGCGCGDEELSGCQVEEEDCGCGDGPDCLSEDGEIELEIDDKDEDLVREKTNLTALKKDTDKVCKKCGMKSKARCMDTSKTATISEKSNKRGHKNTCSCDSLSEFLRIDLTIATCAEPEKRYLRSESGHHQDEKHRIESRSLLKISKAKHDRKIKKSVASEKKRKPSRKESSKEGEKNSKKPRTNPRAVGITPKDVDEDGSSLKTTPFEGGPYGYRTASEEALPVERTIAYLVDRHPPDYPAEEIPVRPGGRPCLCRENRNKRKTLLYGIGGLADTDLTNTDPEKVIEGVLWLTPEPSIRRSDEYIPEYELYDSPYEKQICGGVGKVADLPETSAVDEEVEEENIKEDFNSNDDDRLKDWENAFTDPYLTEFFTKKRDDVPCWKKCSKEKKPNEPRRLKVMKPVCECKYERKIVKRNEERQNWIDRQQKLKSMKKQTFLHIDGIAKVTSTNSNEEEKIDPNQILISEVTMHTPYNTPVHSRSVSNLPYIPIPNKTVMQSSVAVVPVVQKPASRKKYSNRSSSTKSRQLTDASADKTRKTSNSAATDRKTGSGAESGADAELDIAKSSSDVGGKSKRRMSFFDRLEDKLMTRMRGELEQMTNEDFLSIKLPDYHKMPQLAYWISYRARGMCISDKHKKELMEASIKIWNAKAHRAKKEMSAEHLRVTRKDQDKVNFDRARHWKAKIRKMKDQFYKKLREETVNTSSEMWRTMEFGKFPNVLFKQAYFTYLPSKEADAYVFRPWPR